MNLSESIQDPSLWGLLSFLIMWSCHLIIRLINALTIKLGKDAKSGEPAFKYPVTVMLFKYIIRASAYYTCIYFFRIPGAEPGAAFIAGIIAFLGIVIICGDSSSPGRLDFGLCSVWNLWEFQRVALFIICSVVYVFCRKEPVFSLQSVDIWAVAILALTTADLVVREVASWLYKTRFDGLDISGKEDHELKSISNFAIDLS